MLDERAASRLAEMGIDTWVLRSRVVARADAPVASAEPARRDGLESGGRAAPGMPSIVIVGDVARDADQRFLADLRRALRMAGVTPTVDARDAAAVGGPAIVFGASPVSPAGSIDTQVARVQAADWSQLRRDPAAKRALWRDVARLLRALATIARKD